MDASEENTNSNDTNGHVTIKITDNKNASEENTNNNDTNGHVTVNSLLTPYNNPLNSC